MATIMPSSELLKRAVQHLSALRQEHPERKISQLLDMTAMHFNLSPIQCDSLLRLLENEEPQSSESH